MLVRPDTREIAIQIGAEQGAPPPGAAAPLAEILRRPGVLPAMAASLASFAVMVSVMNLSGYVVVQVHHHAQDAVFPIIGAHVLGMYALVMVVGTLIDRIGRTPALAIGLLVMGASVLSLQWVQGVPATAVLLFGLGIGWNISFVAATAQLADLSSALERGKLLGFNDLIASLLGASMALVGGYGLETSGVGALAVGAAVVACRRWRGSCGTSSCPPRRRRLERQLWMRSPRASMATNVSIRLARVAGRWHPGCGRGWRSGCGCRATRRRRGRRDRGRARGRGRRAPGRRSAAHTRRPSDRPHGRARPRAARTAASRRARSGARPWRG